MHVIWRSLRRALSKSAWLAFILLPALLWVPPGCDQETESPAARSARLQAENLARQLEVERRTHRRDLNRAATEIQQVTEDTRAVNTILVSCAITIVILILLLARERRCRRLVERLVRLLLDRIHGPRIPP